MTFCEASTKDLRRARAVIDIIDYPHGVIDLNFM